MPPGGPSPLAPTTAEAFGPAPPGEDPLLDELASVALEAAGAAAAFAASAFGDDLAFTTKSSATDMVSEMDRGAEAAVAAVLRARRPDDGVLGEEGSAEAGTTGIRWVVDPIDGTTNYLFGVPIWSVSIAAERVGPAGGDGEPLVGVVVDPSRGETWAVVAGRGAHCNGRRLAVAAGRSTLPTALVGTGFSYQASRRAWQAEVVRHLLPRVRDLRRFGSAALDLCWVAGGRVDAYYEWGLNPWDRSAGILLCREAGGRAEVLPGRLVVASTPALWDPFVALLGEAGALEPPPGA